MKRLNAIVSVNSTRLLCKSLFYLATLKVEFNFSLQHRQYFLLNYLHFFPNFVL